MTGNRFDEVVADSGFGAFNAWLDTPQGQYVLNWEQARYDHLVADIFGFNAVQLGLPQHDFLRTNRMPFRLRCVTEQALLPAGVGGGEADVGARLLIDPHFLPFANASIDLVILPHLLEFHASPHPILREVERVLVPEGSVIVTGFNPFSLWGLRHRCTAAATARAPWHGRYLSVLRLRDWFTLLGLESHQGGFGCYAPPFSQQNRLERWRFIELAGNRWWPYGGALYIMQAIKRVHGMRLIQPKWHERMARAKAVATVKPARTRARMKNMTNKEEA